MFRACQRRNLITTAPLVILKAKCRLQTTVATAIRDIQRNVFSVRANHERHEDDTLRKVFDSKAFWHDFSQTHRSQAGPSVGLFQNRFLTSHAGFLAFAQDIRTRCQSVVDGVLQASSSEAYRTIPRQLDLLSDYLCRVLDLADFVRATHPDPQYQKSATQAYAYLWEYMNVLNTTPGLKTQLERALATPHVLELWSEEEANVARILLKDFSNSAIDLPKADRQRFVVLSNETKQLGSHFIDGMTPSTPTVRFRSEETRGMDPAILQRYSSGIGKISLPLGGDIAYAALMTMHNSDSREAVYRQSKTVSTSQLQTLETLLRRRAEIAKLSDFPSYAAMNLSDKMAKSPEAVDSFLRALSTDNASRVTHELHRIRVLKESDGLGHMIEPWDVAYFQNRLNHQAQGKSRRLDFLSAYFSLGTVMQGLSRLFSRLYGVRFAPREGGVGETWNPDVRRLDVMHEDDGHVAVLYCDLFERDGKSPNPAHFTLRCSREVSPAEMEDRTLGSHDGMARALNRSTGKTFQLPTIALICDFPHPRDHQSPSLLSFRDVQTLFHEMGHAIHSILGRTSLQVVSGTRCPTDFAELPSVLMESFAADASVLGLFARHWESGAALPYEMVRDVLEAQKRGQGMQTETQILYSLLDQAYHSPLPGKATFDSRQTFYDIYDGFGSVREARGISPQGMFGHLVEYGGTYYSYLFDRAIAGKVWREVFRGGHDGGGVDRAAGERFKEQVLKWGGARNAWVCVSGVLGDERLKNGGTEAMEEVGRWGVHE